MIKWEIVSMESQPDTGIVVSINWKCTSEQDGISAVMSGTSVLPFPEGDYIPYNHLTQQQVLYWVWIDGGVDKDIIESSVNTALTSKANPLVVVKNLPWEQ